MRDYTYFLFKFSCVSGEWRVVSCEAHVIADG